MPRLFPKPEVRQRTTVRWAWLSLSLTLVALAGYFLYPALESFTEREPAPPVPTSADSPPLPQQAEAAPPQAPSQVTSIETIGEIMTPAQPIRTPAPVAAEGVRNRIIGMIPIDVTILIDKNGGVVSAQSATSGDGMQSYLAQRALEAVRQWKFRPAMADQDPIPAEWRVHFQFRSSGVEWN